MVNYVMKKCDKIVNENIKKRANNESIYIISDLIINHSHTCLKDKSDYWKKRRTSSEKASTRSEKH
jgi:hypothetical protein